MISDKKKIKQGSLNLSAVLAPLISIFILMSGAAFFATFTPLRLTFDGFSLGQIGLISASYYIGMSLGVFNNSSFIHRIGHIRAFAAYASIVSFVILISSFFNNLLVWVLSRAITGYGLAGLYIVTESWIIEKSSVSTRGRFLAVYMISLSSASALGQFLLHMGEIDSLINFILIGSLITISIFPLAVTQASNPEIEETRSIGIKAIFIKSPSGVLSCFCSGLLISALTTLFPIYTKAIPETTSAVMFCVFTGGMILQYPIGYLSDLFDRRYTMVIINIVIFFMSMFFIVFKIEDYYLFFYITIFILGGFLLALYPISINETCDLLGSKNVIPAIQAFTLLYGIGSSVGPLIASRFMNYFGEHDGIFYYFIVITTMLTIVLGFFIIKVKRTIKQNTNSQFIPVSQVAPTMMELGQIIVEHKKKK